MLTVDCFSAGRRASRVVVALVILAPFADYERTGDVPNVVFPSGLLHDEASDEIRLYYGAADSSICLATARLRDLLDAVLAAPCET